MKSDMFLEKLLQKMRFNRIIPFIIGDSLLDFGGNRGELKGYIKQHYTLCQRDYSVIKNKSFDTIVMLAVIEHLEYRNTFKIISMLKSHLNANGRIILTTPSPCAKLILDTLAYVGLLDKENMKEHKHYWSKKDLNLLARKTKLKITVFKYFQFGLNQMVVLDK
jgi:2-polyprenyl-3-methyl-5-hydroxy-6-metoxy-1,4-benzoquinol methylase